MPHLCFDNGHAGMSNYRAANLVQVFFNPRIARLVTVHGTVSTGAVSELTPGLSTGDLLPNTDNVKVVGDADQRWYELAIGSTGIEMDSELVTQGLITLGNSVIGDSASDSHVFNGTLNIDGDLTVTGAATVPLAAPLAPAGDLLPATDIIYNLGSSLLRWNEIHCNVSRATGGTTTIYNELNVDTASTVGSTSANTHQYRGTTHVPENTVISDGNLTADTLRSSNRVVFNSPATLGNVVTKNYTIGNREFIWGGTGTTTTFNGNLEVTGTVTFANPISSANQGAYDSGTWTPTVTNYYPFTFSMTPTCRGRYVRLGNVVHITVSIVFPEHNWTHRAVPFLVDFSLPTLYPRLENIHVQGAMYVTQHSDSHSGRRIAHMIPAVFRPEAFQYPLLVTHYAESEQTHQTYYTSMELTQVDDNFNYAKLSQNGYVLSIESSPYEVFDEGDFESFLEGDFITDDFFGAFNAAPGGDWDYAPVAFTRGAVTIPALGVNAKSTFRVQSPYLTTYNTAGLWTAPMATRGPIYFQGSFSYRIAS